jgi:hypothetical protein
MRSEPQDIGILSALLQYLVVDLTRVTANALRRRRFSPLKSVVPSQDFLRFPSENA